MRTTISALPSPPSLTVEHSTSWRFVILLIISVFHCVDVPVGTVCAIVWACMVVTGMREEYTYIGCGAEWRHVTDPVGGGGCTRSESVKLSHQSRDRCSHCRGERVWEENVYHICHLINRLIYQFTLKQQVGLTCPVQSASSCRGRAGSGSSPRISWPQTGEGWRGTPSPPRGQSGSGGAPGGSRNTPRPGWLSSRTQRQWRWRRGGGSELGSEPACFQHSASART